MVKWKDHNKRFKGYLESIAVYSGAAILLLLTGAFLIQKEVFSQHETQNVSAVAQVTAICISCLILKGKWIHSAGIRGVIHAGTCILWTVIWNVILFRTVELHSLWTVPTAILLCFCISRFKKSSKMTKVSYGKMKHFRHI